MFFGEKPGKACGKDDVTGHELAGKLAPQYDFYCLIQTNVPLNQIANTSHVLAQLIADEADNKVSHQQKHCVYVVLVIPPHVTLAR